MYIKAKVYVRDDELWLYFMSPPKVGDNINLSYVDGYELEHEFTVETVTHYPVKQTIWEPSVEIWLE